MSENEIDAEIEEMRSCIEAEKAAGEALRSASIYGVGRSASIQGVATRRAATGMARVASPHGANATAALEAGGAVTAETISETDATAATYLKRTKGVPPMAMSMGDGQAPSRDGSERGIPPAAAAEAVRSDDEGGSTGGGRASRGDSVAGGAVADDGGTGRVWEAPQPTKLWRSNTPAHWLLGILSPVRRQLRLGVGLMLLQQLVGINTIMYYSTPILKQVPEQPPPEHVTPRCRLEVVERISFPLHFDVGSFDAAASKRATGPCCRSTVSPMRIHNAHSPRPPCALSPYPCPSSPCLPPPVQAFYSGEPDVSLEERAFVIWLSAPVACGQLIGCLAGMHLIDREGRRPLVLRCEHSPHPAPRHRPAPHARAGHARGGHGGPVSLPFFISSRFPSP
jgi:hypothetical protein